MPQSVASQTILIISHEVVGNKMAGPGIRFCNFARVLGREFDVILAIPNQIETSFPSAPFRIVAYRRDDWKTIQEIAAIAQIVICPSAIASDFPQLGSNGIPLVIDGYDPVWAEWLASVQTDRQQEAQWQAKRGELNHQCLVGDFFICASERQRDWWLGTLEASGRINPYTFRDDHSLRRLIDTVPYGLPEDPPQSTRLVIKGMWNGIADQDRVILWGGGLWPWLDPLTAIRAIAKVYEQRRDVRLIFPGTNHPNPILKNLPTHNDAARDLAKQLGLLDQVVFFGDWVPHEDWQNVLLESDVALTLHREETFEARLAFRSRVLDYIWAGLPIVATRGDTTSDMVEQNRLGIVVESDDVAGVANAIIRVLDDPADYQRCMEKLRPALTWEHVTQPLRDFCRAPRCAPDKLALGEKLSSPHYVAKIVQLQEQLATANNSVNFLHNDNKLLRIQLDETISAYEHRRVVRLANWLSRTFGRVRR